MNVRVRDLGTAEVGAARTVLEEACSYDPAAEVAEEKLFGDAAGYPWRRTLAAEEEGRLLGVAVASGRWLRLLAVAPFARGRGVGSALLRAAEREFAGRGARVARTLDQPGNYLAPGIAVENREAIEWLGRRGWKEARENTNLLIDLEENPKLSPERIASIRGRAESAGYQIARAGAGDAASLAAAVEREFSRGWAFEVARAIEAPPGAVHAAWTAGGEPAAFAAHDGNNRGLAWFGPAGTFPAHRGRGLGAALLVACLLDMARAGHRCGTIAWIGPREFYQRVAGVAGERRYLVLTKEIPSR